MINLLGPRPFETADPYDDALAAPGTPAPTPLPPAGRLAKEQEDGETNPLPLGEGIEGGAGVPIPQPQGIDEPQPRVAASAKE